MCLLINKSQLHNIQKRHKWINDHLKLVKCLKIYKKKKAYETYGLRISVVSFNNEAYNGYLVFLIK